MTELEGLTRNINGLTELLRVPGEALQTRSSHHLSAAKRYQIDQYNVEFRRQLRLIEAERSHSLEENDGRNFSKRKLRLLPDGWEERNWATLRQWMKTSANL
jgi:hypothetical protein